MSRGCFVWFVGTVGSSEVSSAQLRCVKTGGSEGFWVEMDGFSSFW